MRYDVILPDIGEGLAEARIVALNAAVGKPVAEGDPLLTVETDKVVTEIPSPKSGRLLRFSVKEGETVRVGATVAILETEGDRAASVVGELSTSGTILPASVERVPVGELSGAKATASPVARKLASEMGVSLESLKGTGPGGRVLKEDVRRAADAPKRTVPPFAAEGAPVRRKLSAVRKTIAARMELSRQIPAAAIHEALDADKLVALRGELGAKVSYLSFFVKAVALALREYPLLNCFYDPGAEECEMHGEAHIGIAVDPSQGGQRSAEPGRAGADHSQGGQRSAEADAGGGLVVPVIHDAGDLSVPQTQAEVDRLAAKARSGQLDVSDLRGGTFTITNYGSFAGIYGQPLILPPQVAILGAGRIHPEPLVRDGAVVAAYVLPLSLVFDHRVVDGMYAARFLKRVMELLSAPLVLLAR